MHNAANRHIFYRLTRYFGHSLWIAMLLVHLPALLKGWSGLLTGGEGPRLAGFVALNLSAILFILKIRGVRWLRFHTDRRSLLTLTVAVALLHVNVLSESTTPVAIQESTSAVAGLLLFAGCTDLRRLLAATARRPHPHQTSAWRYAESAIVPQPIWVSSHAPPRAPPLFG